MGLFTKRKAVPATQAPPAAQAAPAKPARRKSKRWRYLIAGMSCVTILGLAALAGLFFTYSLRFPDPLSLAHRQTAPVITLLARDGTELAARGMAQSYMPLDLLPPHVPGAVIAIEDRRFFSHWGIDTLGLARAAAYNLRAGRFAQGGSTLTQQLAKNLFLNGDRTLARKLEEVTFALWLELRLGKRDILELYLNRVYFGGGAFGIEAAAQLYFAKSARDLDVAEAAILAGLLKAPVKYSPAVNPQAARLRGQLVLAAMVARGGPVGALALSSGNRTPVFAPPQVRSDDGLGYAIDYALDRLPPIKGQGFVEIIVETTIDAAIQKAAHKAVTRHLAGPGSGGQAAGGPGLGGQASISQTSEAAVVVMERSGAIRALIGGRSHVESQFNRAVKARRQPGSAFKPFVYLAAIESGLTPETVSYDLPLNIQGWSPKNDNGKYQGAITLRQALAGSVNTVAVRLYQDAPKGRVIEVAKRLGIVSPLRDAPALALGASEVSLFEITSAYAVLANGGLSVAPHVIEKVRLASGAVLYQREVAKSVALVAPDAVAAMNDMLGEVVATGTGRRAALAGMIAAGKTGTSQAFRDAWFVGYTAELTAGVWVGNDAAQPMNHVRGGALPAQIWHDVMEVAHRNRTRQGLPGRPLTQSLTQAASAP